MLMVDLHSNSLQENSQPVCLVSVLLHCLQPATEWNGWALAP